MPPWFHKITQATYFAHFVVIVLIPVIIVAITFVFNSQLGAVFLGGVAGSAQVFYNPTMIIAVLIGFCWLGRNKTLIPTLIVVELVLWASLVGADVLIHQSPFLLVCRAYAALVMGYTGNFIKQFLGKRINYSADHIGDNMEKPKVVEVKHVICETPMDSTLATDMTIAAYIKIMFRGHSFTLRLSILLAILWAGYYLMHNYQELTYTPTLPNYYSEDCPGAWTPAVPAVYDCSFTNSYPPEVEYVKCLSKNNVDISGPGKDCKDLINGTCINRQQYNDVGKAYPAIEQECRKIYNKEEQAIEDKRHSDSNEHYEAIIGKIILNVLIVPLGIIFLCYFVIHPVFKWLEMGLKNDMRAE